MTVWGEHCFFLWPVFLFTYITWGDCGYPDMSPLVQWAIVPLTCQNNVTSWWVIEKWSIGFSFCTMSFTLPQTGTPSSLCMCCYSGWSQAQTLTAEVITSSDLVWIQKDHVTPLSRGTKTTQSKGRKNTFSLIIWLGSWKLILITPNSSGSAVSQPVETGHC